jgi:signal transduction histidine kinase
MKHSLEYSRITALPLGTANDGTAHILEIIASVTVEEMRRVQSARNKAELISKLIAILSQSYDPMSLAFLLFALVAPEGFGFESAYLFMVEPDESHQPVPYAKEVVFMCRPQHSQVMLHGLLALDPQDRLALIEFYDAILSPLCRTVKFEGEAVPIIPVSVAAQISSQHILSVEYGLKAAIMPLQCAEASLNAYIIVDHGSESAFVTGEELADLSLLSSAARQAIALGAMRSSLYGVLTGIVARDYDSAMIELAKGMALTRIHELSEAWGILRPYYRSLRGFLPDKQLTNPAVEALLRDTEVAEKIVTDHLSRLKQLRKLVRPRYTRIDLLEILRAVYEKRRPHASDHGVEFTLHPRFGECVTIGDKEHLFIAFDNLVSNALYFLAKKHRWRSTGHLRIKWCIENGKVVVSVWDDGPGVPADIRWSVFLPFFSTKEPEGFGMGLTITRLIIENVGGSIKLNSVEKHWTEFTVELPTA